MDVRYLHCTLHYPFVFTMKTNSHPILTPTPNSSLNFTTRNTSCTTTTIPPLFRPFPLTSTHLCLSLEPPLHSLPPSHTNNYTEPMMGERRQTNSTHHTEILLRKENANQKALKEKFVVVYEALFNVSILSPLKS